MPVPLMDQLRDYGWYLTEQGLEIATDYGSITDAHKVIKRAVDCDLKEIGSGEGSYLQSDLVVQIQKLRNISAPKYNEESRGAPRMLKFSLTDGKNNYQAIEIEHISNISLNTPPGTKLIIKKQSTPFLSGIILLSPKDIVQVLGGKVSHMVEKWELNKKLASHSRVRSVEEGGPPPWIPFGKKIIKIMEQGKNLKTLSEKEKPSEENAEFEAQRKNAIAEAAKQGSRKVFGGGNKQLLDHSVQKIVDQGFTIEQAEYALKVNRNNVDRALKSLLKTDNKSNSNAREPRELKSKRGDKKSEEAGGKPSSGKISLFDFLEDKLPAQAETMETSNSHFSDSHGRDRMDNYSERHHSRGNDYSQSSRGGGAGSGRNAKGSRNYQVPPRHQDEGRSNKYSNNNTNSTNQPYGQYSQKNKPPRFQRNQSSNQNLHQDMQNLNLNQNYSSYQQQQPDPIGTYSKFPQVGEFRNSMPTVPPFPQNRQDSVTPRDFPGGAFKQNLQDYSNHQDYQTKVVNNSRNQNYRAPEMDHSFYQPSLMDNRSMKVPQQHQQQNRYYSSVNDNVDFQGMPGVNTHKNSGFHNNSNRNDETLGGTWMWRVGDRCMAKYWEDNMYYNAEVTAVSKTTCVVQFKDFHNYEEVLQLDCIPITDDNVQMPSLGLDNNRRSDHRSNNRPPRFEHNQNNVNSTEYRRGGSGGGGGGSGSGMKVYRKRGQQRTAQPIYQPPAQRGAPAYLPQNT
ncbi:tudor domain-containing protein 3 [Copidosoma floridanum]|uniref:tudor domain-containing protein 3 n=1 Tax=Copidosoma floridanum TaxID=29053 RepID=UPI0006C94E71|nr:tudor domain-containing protein 3 [Copidosoma floridanum]